MNLPIVVFLLVVLPYTQSATFYVSTTGDDSASGNAANPFQTLAVAVQTATNDDTIIVRDGVYSGTGNRDISVDKRLIIRAQNSGAAVFNLSSAAGHRALDIENVQESRATANGFGDVHIEGLSFMFGSQVDGGAIKLVNSFVSLLRVSFIGCSSSRGGALFAGPGSSLLVNDSAFVGNVASGSGGAVYVGNFARFERTLFERNQAGGDGGGVYATLADLTLVGVNATLNRAGGGGFLFVQHSQMTMDGCWLNASMATDLGAGIFSVGSVVNIENSEFTEGVGIMGGGMYALSGISTIRSSTFTNNGRSSGPTVTVFGGGISLTSMISIRISDVIVRNNYAQEGGGMAISNAVALLDNFVCSENNAIRGAGIWARNANIEMHDSMVTRNVASLLGGGYGANIQIRDIGTITQLPFVLVIRSTIFANNIAQRGGGFGMNATVPLLVAFQNCLVSSNSAEFGGGIWWRGANTTLLDTTVTENQAVRGGGLFLFDNATVSYNDDSSIDRNNASFAGGGIFFGDSTGDFFPDQDFDCDICDSNEAGYGPDIATDPMRVEISPKLPSNIVNKNKKRLTVSVVDHFNQTIRNEESTMVIDVEPQNAILVDFEPVQFRDGEEDFDFEFVGEIEESYTITFTVEGVEAEVMEIEVEDCDLSEEYYAFFPENTERFRVCEDVSFEDDSGSVFAIRVVIYALCAVMMILTIMLMILVLVNKNRPVFHYASVPFIELTLGGFLFMYAAVILFAADADNDFVCAARPWFAVTGFSLIFGSIIVKTFRVWRLFYNEELRVVKLTNAMLFPFVAGLLAIQWIVCAVWMILSTPEADWNPNGSTDSERFRYCTSENSDVFLGVLLSLNATLLLVGVFFSFKTKDVAVGFNEARHIAVAVYSITMLALVLIPFIILQQDEPLVFLLLLAGGSFVGTVLVEGCLFIPKIVRFVSQEDLSKSRWAFSTGKSKTGGHSAASTASTL